MSKERSEKHSTIPGRPLKPSQRSPRRKKPSERSKHSQAQARWMDKYDLTGLHVRIPRSLMDDLTRRAKARGMSRNAYTQHILETYLRKVPNGR